MSSIFYLWRRSIRNYMVNAIKKPLPLILYLLFMALIIFSMVMGMSSEVVRTERNVNGYAAVLLGVFLMIGVLSLMNGMKQGTALFTMADVNLLFTAPVDASKVLLSGIAKQMAILTLASLFLLAQYPNMRNAGLDGMALVGLIISYIAVGLVGNILAAALYGYCAGEPGRRGRVYTILMALGAVLLLLTGWYFLREGNAAAALLKVFGADAWEFVPVFGWARGLAVAFAEHRYLRALLFLALMVGGGYACLRLLRRADTDYFEDVLLAAERAGQVQLDASAGRMTGSDATVSKRAQRVGGPLRGRGAGAFTHRILREQQRGGIWMLDGSTLAAAGIPLLCMVFASRDMLTGTDALIMVYSMTLWLLIFLNLRSPLVREFAYPYLYLAPAPPFRKLFAVLLPALYKSMIDGVVYGIMLFVLLQMDAASAVTGTLLYVSVSMLYAVGYLLIARFLGMARNRMLTMLLYILLLMVLCIPGFVGALIIGSGWPHPLPYIACAIYNVVISALLLFLGRNLLLRGQQAG